jgi:hypothetical protein
MPTWWLDWETPEAAIVSEGGLTVGIRGVMFDTDFGLEEPDIEIPSLPNYDPEMS